ncbi:hypothetical protein X743_28330 [Mesorhizobium sp. LNHC252B00]|nr:hypothetical protein X743_28330 [Mesorhizobium sp. LNHC252B00]
MRQELPQGLRNILGLAVRTGYMEQVFDPLVFKNAD